MKTLTLLVGAGGLLALTLYVKCGHPVASKPTAHSAGQRNEGGLSSSTTGRHRQRPALAPTHPSPASQPLRSGAAIPSQPGLYPRAPEESQKRRLFTQFTMKCTTSHDCCAAMACINGICTGCTSSDQCLDGEMCALDHCILQENTNCINRHDCNDESLCVLSRKKKPVDGQRISIGADCRNNTDFSSNCDES